MAQLYNSRVVFNRKRTGDLTVGGIPYSFKLWREAPKELAEEFLVDELLHRINELVEDLEALINRLTERLSTFNKAKLKKPTSTDLEYLVSIKKSVYFILFIKP